MPLRAGLRAPYTPRIAARRGAWALEHMCHRGPSSTPRSVASIRAIRTSSSPATQRAYTRSCISTLCPAQAAISVGGTPELRRHVMPECRRSYGSLVPDRSMCVVAACDLRRGSDVRIGDPAVHLADRPGLLPNPFHHQGASVLCCSQPQRGVIVDLHPGPGVRSARPPAPDVETVVIGEEDD
jgi:hypothetical protein